MSWIHDLRGLDRDLRGILSRVEKRLYTSTDHPDHEKAIAGIREGLQSAIDSLALLMVPVPTKASKPKGQPVPIVPDPERCYIVTFAPGGQQALIKTSSRLEATTIADDIAKSHGFASSGADFVRATREDVDGRTFRSDDLGRKHSSRFIEVRV